VALAEPLAAQPSGGIAPVNIYSGNAKNAVMASNAIAMGGGGQPHENRQPFLLVSFYFALTGGFSSRD
jgi:microcystin-dependent protein